MALPLLGVYWSHMSIDEQMIKIDRPLPRFFHQKTEAKNKTFEETSTFTPKTPGNNSWVGLQRCRSMVSLRGISLRKSNEARLRANSKLADVPEITPLPSSFKSPRHSRMTESHIDLFQNQKQLRTGLAKERRNCLTPFRIKSNRIIETCQSENSRDQKTQCFSPKVSYASYLEVKTLNRTPRPNKIKEEKFCLWKNISKTPKNNVKPSSVKDESKTRSKKTARFSSIIFWNKPMKQLPCYAPDESLNLLLKDKNKVQRFRKFLQVEFSEENLDFWLQVEKYKKLNKKQQIKSAQRIYDTFIAEHAPREVNIDSKVRKTTKENISEPDNGTFNSAQLQIFNLMENDPFRRFVKSKS